MTSVVFTAGYSGLSLSQLVAKAVDLDAVVIDVRMNPMARNPEFRRGPMVSALGERYLHVGELGNVNYKNGGPIALADKGTGLAIVEKFLGEGAKSVILLCGCWNVQECHRKVVADLLAGRGYEVVHLYKQDFSKVQAIVEDHNPQMPLF